MNVVRLTLILLVLFFSSLVQSFYVPSEVLGALLIPHVMRAGSMAVYRVGKLIGTRANSNHGIHGGPIHHVFPTTFHSSGQQESQSQVYDTTYNDYDEDEPLPPPPKLHQNVVDGHYSDGTHYHYSNYRRNR